MDGKERLDQLLGPSPKVLELLRHLKNNREMQRLVTDIKSLTPSQKKTMELFGISADKFYSAERPQNVSMELTTLLTKVNQAVLASVHSVQGEFLPYMLERFKVAGFPMRHIVTQIANADITCVEVLLDGVAYIIPIPPGEHYVPKLM